MNFERIYEYRFKGVNPEKKEIVWKEVSKFICKKLGNPDALLDPASGYCEFINNAPAKEKWGVDLNKTFLSQNAKNDVKQVVGDNLTVELPKEYFDGIFVSNFLEHLKSQDEVSVFLERLFGLLKKGGRLAVIGPNFKYCYNEYFDFCDHTVVLSDLAVAEHLYGAGFMIRERKSRFLPLSFRSDSLLPVNKITVSSYLKLPIAWPLFGKQFLLIAEK